MLIKNKNSFVVFFVSLLVGLVLLNLTSRDIFHRFDLTDNKMFSLSNSSESILEKVDDRLTIKVYFSDNLPNELGNTRRYLQDILEEYRAVSKNINFYFYDPESDSELEEQARKDGIQPVQMQSLENDQMVVKKVYLGMVLLYEDKKETLPVIQTTAGLEYMISTKLKALINADKKTIGLLNLASETESKNDNLAAQLREHYNFRTVQSGTSIPSNMDVLLVSGTLDTLDSITYKEIEKFLTDGKKLLLAQSGVSTDLQTQQASEIQSNIFDLLKTYRFDLQKNLVLDGNCGKVTVQVRQGPFLIPYPMDYPFFPIIDRFNKKSVVVSDLENVRPLFPSEIKIDTVEGKTAFANRAKNILNIMPTIMYTDILKKEFETIIGDKILSKDNTPVKKHVENENISEDIFDVKESTLISLLIEYPKLINSIDFEKVISDPLLIEIYNVVKEGFSHNENFKAASLINVFPDNKRVQSLMTFKSNESSEESALLTAKDILSQLEKTSDERLYFNLLK